MKPRGHLPRSRTPRAFGATQRTATERSAMVI
jgi:hypothetical protein